MNGLSGIEKFERCQLKGYRRCPNFKNSIMQEAIVGDIPESRTPVILHSPSLEDEETVASLCVSCSSFMD